MKKRSITLMMSALTISAALLATSPVLAETDAKDAAETTEESTDAKDTADDKDAEKAENTDAENTDDKKDASSAENTLEDGVYTAEFDTDSGMFHVNEANDGKGTLTVKDGKMTIHITLRSTNIVNLYPGLAEDAQKDGAELLQPVVETVDYNDGEPAEEVNAFDVPVPAIDEEFDLALIGTKGKWYDHKVSVSNPVKAEE